MRKISYLSRIGIMAGLLILAIIPSMAAIQVDLNGSPLSFSVQPIQINGRTMVPLRGIFEALGAQVNWDATSRMITANKGGTEVELTIGDPHATVNGQTVILDTPAMIMSGSTMVPLRFISEALGADVKWFEATQTVTITTSSDSSMGSPPIDQGYVEPSYNSGPVVDNGPYQYSSFSNAELDDILGPIALYPDPLIAQILPASTFPDQLLEADRFVRQRGGRDIDNQDWDISVRAISYYPSVLSMMASRQDWTISLGQAYVNQPDQVMRSIQRLRNRARSYGYLSTNQYQRVYLDSDNIRIVPVQPRYIYVPQYNPQVVYLQRRNQNSSNIISFGLGLLIGSWLNRDVDWSNDRVYYHGWSGRGWIDNSRPQIRTNNDNYINNNYRDKPVEVDRSVINRNLGSYRDSIRKNAGTYRLPQSDQPNAIRDRNNGSQPPVIKQPSPRDNNQGNKANGKSKPKSNNKDKNKKNQNGN